MGMMEKRLWMRRLLVLLLLVGVGVIMMLMHGGQLVVDDAIGHSPALGRFFSVSNVVSWQRFLGIGAAVQWKSLAICGVVCRSRALRGVS